MPFMKLRLFLPLFLLLFLPMWGVAQEDWRIENIAALRSFDLSPSHSAVFVLGYYTVGDAGGGDFYWDPASTENDNGGTTIKPASLSSDEPGRWRRIVTDSLSVRWFGAKGNGADNPAADDTNPIQKAIDTADDSNLTVLFPTGYYRHRGLTLRAGVRLMGVSRQAVNLDYVLTAGDAITLLANADRAAISDMRLVSSGRTSGWMINASNGVVNREQRFANLVIGHSLKGIIIADPQVCTINFVYMEGPITYVGGQPKPTRGSIGIQIGLPPPSEFRGNGATIYDAYVHYYDKNIVTWGDNISIYTPQIDSSNIGIESHGHTAVFHPWMRYNETADISVNNHGILLVGYGSSEWKIVYGDNVVKERSVIIPDSVDARPDIGTAVSDRGLKLGRFLVQRDGTVDFSGGVPNTTGTVRNLTGLSATTTVAKNLRGSISFARNETRKTVTFNTPEPDASYFIAISADTIEGFSITLKSKAGFTVSRSSKSSVGAAVVDWILVR